MIGLSAKITQNSKTTWLVKVQMTAIIDDVSDDSPKCVCDNELLQHQSYCVFYAPSPQEIYKQILTSEKELSNEVYG